MPCPRWDEDGVTWDHATGDASDLHLGAAFENEIEFLTESMVVTLSAATSGHGGFGERLVLHGCVRQVQETADGGTVLGGEGRLGGK